MSATPEGTAQEGVPFSKIEEQGDAGLKRIVATLRRSREGEKIYQYATRKQLKLTWEDSDQSGGSYMQGVVYVSRILPSDAASYILAHEVAHGMQDKTLKARHYQKGPLMAWQVHQLSEIGACAYAAHYAAKWKDEIKEPMNIPGSYGKKTARSYETIPAAKRHFFKDAVVPCAQEIQQYTYDSRHLEWALGTLNQARSSSEIIRLSAQIAKWHPQGYDTTGDRSIFNAVPTKDKAQFLARTLTTLLDPQDIPPVLRADNDPEDTLRNIIPLARGDKQTMSVIFNAQTQFVMLRANALRAHNRALQAQSMKAAPGAAP